MLNKNNQRELAYLVTVDDIRNVIGSDNCECAVVGGWSVLVHKNEFKKGDLAIYFEIDSKLPEIEPFEFLRNKHFKVKTQKYTFGGHGNFISQGLVVHPSVLGWTVLEEATEDNSICYQIGIESPTGSHLLNDESRFLTKELEVTYAVAEDSTRKAPTVDKYKKMAQRHPKAARTWIWRMLWKSKFGKDILFFFFGKNIRKDGWPSWVVKTDEERIENMPWIFTERDENGEKYWWLPTEKIDGTSTTFTIKRGKAFSKNEFLVCSRNVVFDKPDKKCFYNTNVYTEMAEKYEIERVLTRLLDVNPDTEWFTIQGETFGDGIQKRTYNNEIEFRVFNLIDSKNGRWSSDTAKQFLKAFYKRNELHDKKYKNHLEWVPIFDKMQLPDTLEELRSYVHSTPSVIDGGMREGIVFRSLDGTRSFKCVDPEYLIKYHC